eukprot:3173178-Prymnesium_polylepis.1
MLSPNVTGRYSIALPKAVGATIEAKMCQASPARDMGQLRCGPISTPTFAAERQRSAPRVLVVARESGCSRPQHGRQLRVPCAARVDGRRI